MPRPDATPAFIAALQSPYCRPAIFVQIGMVSGPVYVWSGVGTVFFNGATYQGVGQFGMISNIEEGSDVLARGMTVGLSGFDATLLGDVLADYQQGLPVLIYLGLFDINGNLIPNPIISFAGRTDQPTITCSGETASISIACESRLAEMNTTGSFRRYTNEDQQIDYPGDLAFTQVNQIQQETLYWGRTPGSQNLGVSSSS